MGTVAIVALSACGILWIAAVVEFSRTLGELTRCRRSASRVLENIAQGR